MSRSLKRVQSFIVTLVFDTADPCADMIFPVLPRWFTEPLRANDPSSSARPKSSDYSNIASPFPSLTPVGKAPHEHVILEFLFNSVFESRFINMKPTGLFYSSGSENGWLTLGRWQLLFWDISRRSFPDASAHHLYIFLFHFSLRSLHSLRPPGQPRSTLVILMEHPVYLMSHHTPILAHRRLQAQQTARHHRFLSIP